MRQRRRIFTIPWIAYRSLQEVVTGLELCERLYPGPPATTVAPLVDEGNQIARMTHGLMQRLSEKRGWGHG